MTIQQFWPLDTDVEKEMPEDEFLKKAKERFKQVAEKYKGTNPNIKNA